MFMKKIKVMCGGCFNRIHKGHVYFLKKAKSLGDELIISLAHDNINKRKYGKAALSGRIRKRNLEKLKIADKILLGDPKDRMKVVLKERPDIIALGHDQKMPELRNLRNIERKIRKKIKIVRIDEYDVD